jgi:cysteine desulfurase/selenocysteine lyase
MNFNANIHRGIHALAEKATKEFERTRIAVRDFINASAVEEIVFVRGVTEAINLVASSYGRSFIEEGDEIIVSELEHHSNIVPWQILCKEKKAILKVIPINDEGDLILDEFVSLLSGRTKLVAVSHVSNSLGTINPIKEIIRLAHHQGTVVLIDGAQAGAHQKIDVQDLDCDFYCLSAHKMYGPTGVGILYGKRHILEIMPPYHGGGEMIREVTFAKTTYNDLPYKFEAGTPHIAGVVAFRKALEFMSVTGHDYLIQHDKELLAYATERLSKLSTVRLVGTSKEKVGIVSFVMEGFHPYDIGHILNARGIAVRTGQHCTQPLMDRLGIDGTVRLSLAIYNTRQEIDELIRALRVINFIK